MIRLFWQVCLASLSFFRPTDCLSKVSPDLQTRLQKGDKVTVLVSFDGIEDICNHSLSQVRSPLAAERSIAINTMKTKLEEKMHNSQDGIYNLLSKQKAKGILQFTQFWITNQILIRGADLDLVQEISQDPKVTFIMEEPKVEALEDQQNSLDPKDLKGIVTPTGEPQPNLKLIKVPEAWELLGGQKGDGIVVGVIDTGVRGTHENLKDSFLGEYGWLDPTEGAKPEPYDYNGHGTHVTGFIVGAKGVGVATNAKWMACGYNGADQEHFFEQLLKCAEFMICPTLSDGSNANCSKAPHIINNSWGVPRNLLNNIHIRPHLQTMNNLIDCWKTAGIIPVFGLGNEGYKCDSARYPAYSEKVINVGNTDLNDSVSKMSSRGPTPDGKIAPDICAPGKDLLGPTAIADNSYVASWDGTSLSTPHVTGAIALLLNKNNNLKFEQIKEMLRQSTDKIPQTHGEEDYNNCGNTTVGEFPNNLIGYGRLNVFNLLSMDPPAL